MSDDRSPSASPDDTTPGRPDRPQYGEYAPPGWTPPEPQAQWAPPPAPAKPGLIPLRPLLLGDMIVAAFAVIRRNPRPTFWLAFALGLLANLIAAALVALVLWTTLPRLDQGAAPDLETLRGIVVALALTAYGAALLQFVLIAIPQAVVTIEVARATLGERLTLRGLWAQARGRVGALIGWMLLFGGSAGLIIVIVVLGLSELALTGGLGGLGAAVGLGILAALAMLAIAFWIGTRLAFVPALIVIERLAIGAALRRSWAMTQGSFWRILGIGLLANLIVQAGAQVLMMPVTVASSLGEPSQALDGRLLAVLGVTLLLQGLVTGVAIVIQAAVAALLYLDVRMRREGFDTVLRESADDRAAGRTPSADPFG